MTEFRSRAEDSPDPATEGAGGTRSQESLSRLLRPAVHGEVETERLRDAVHDYVNDARERGEPVERVIVDLKQEIRAAAGIGLYVSRETRAVMESVVRWCIEGYYEGH